MRTQSRPHNLRSHLAGFMTLVIAAVIINHMMIHTPSDTPLNIRTAGTMQLQQTSRVPDEIEEAVAENRTRKARAVFNIESAVALVKLDQLYLIDAQARVVTRADSAGFVDMPILSGDMLEIDVPSGRVTGKDLDAALNTLQLLKSRPELYAQCSEIIVDADQGVIAFMDWNRVLPVILGQRDIEPKIEKLNVLAKHIGGIPELSKSRYVDLRVEGRAVIKQNNG